MSARRLRLFRRWLLSAGVNLSDALHLSITSTSGISVVAASSLSVGDLVALIPKRACLTAVTTEAASIISEAGMDGQLALAFAVMYERARGSESLWYGYLQLLPESEPVPLVWEDEELSTLLGGTELDKVVKHDKKCAYEDWKESIKPLLVSSLLDADPKYFGFDQYLSAISLVSSRSFKVDGFHGSGMVPLADLFNHKTDAENVHLTSVSCSDSDADSDDISDVTANEESPMVEANVSSPGMSDSDLEMIIVRAVAAGNEVFNTYGSMGNAALFYSYGFTELGNPYDIVRISIKLLIAWSSAIYSNRYTRARLSLWRRLNSADYSSPDECFEVAYDGKPAPELLVLLYIISLRDDAYDKLSLTVDELRSMNDCDIAVSLIRCTGTWNDKESADECEQDDPSALLLTENVRCGLFALADMREELYGPTTLEDDEKQLQDCCCGRDPKLYHSTVLRVSERRILRRLRQRLSKQ